MTGEGGSEGKRGELITLPFQEIQVGQSSGPTTGGAATSGIGNDSRSKRPR